MSEKLFDHLDVPGGHLEREIRYNVFHGFAHGTEYAGNDGEYLGVFQSEREARDAVADLAKKDGITPDGTK